MRLSTRLIAIGLAGFAVTTALVALGATRSIDQAVLDASQTIDDPILDVVSSIIGLLGSAEVTGLAAIGLALASWRTQGSRALAWPLLLVAGVVLEVVLKFTLPHPPTPADADRSIELLPMLSLPSPYSFPSGHLFRATFLSTALARTAATGLRIVLVVFVAAMLATRMYLGEHWLSDGIGGIFLGLGFAGVAMAVAPVVSRGGRG